MFLLRLHASNDGVIGNQIRRRRKWNMIHMAHSSRPYPRLAPRHTHPFNRPNHVPLSRPMSHFPDLQSLGRGSKKRVPGNVPRGPRRGKAGGTRVGRRGVCASHRKTASRLWAPLTLSWRVSRRGWGRQGRAEARAWTSQYSRGPCSPPSRPKPLCFMPPKGAWGMGPVPLLRATWPKCRAATRHRARSGS